MTWEEAIEVLENGGWWDLLIPITTIEGRVEEDKLHEALALALSALRPVDREQLSEFKTCDLVDEAESCKFADEVGGWEKCPYFSSDEHSAGKVEGGG